MFFKQFYLGCLAHASYMIGSEGEGAVVDPQRDVEQYIAEAAARNLQIKYVIETHLHADFVSGHRELAARTGAEIIFGERAQAKFPHRAVRDGDEIKLGKVLLKFIETPGHTPEGISILVTDTENPNEPSKILTGDTLFIGDVGRPDLAGSKGYTTEQMAAMLYDTLHDKILTLPDETEVYPAHGAGSMCGRNISNETSSTIGVQRRTNYALQRMSKDEFVRMMTENLPPAPGYFSMDAELNRAGAGRLDELPKPNSLSPTEVKKMLADGHIALDVSANEKFGAGHIPGSINIGLKGQFASWAGTLLSPQTPIILIADTDAEVNEAQMRLARVGLEKVAGYLAGGITAWRDAGFEVARIPQITVAELHEILSQTDDAQILDVRRTTEYEQSHVPHARNIPLDKLTSSNLDELDSQKPLYVICAGGYRSSAATSLLEARGFQNLHNIIGGTSAWINAGYETEAA
jgi:hydroxyacylglutathione hydrolase